MVCLWRSLLDPHVSRRQCGVAASDEVEEATDGLVSMIDGLGIQAMLDRHRVTPEYQLRVIDTQLGALGLSARE